MSRAYVRFGLERPHPNMTLVVRLAGMEAFASLGSQNVEAGEVEVGRVILRDVMG